MNTRHPGGDVTGLVLAGGRGTRMGGLDKGLVELRGRPLAQRALDALRPQVDALLISANRNEDRYRAFGAPVIADASSDFRGPLAGMLAGLRACRTPWLACLPCDMSYVPQRLVHEMKRWATVTRNRAAFAVFDDEPLYVCALLHRDLARSIEGALDRDERSVWQWLAAESACAVPFELPPEARANVNTLAELARC